MFEMMIAEKMKSEFDDIADNTELEPQSLRTVQINHSRVDRALSALGQAMIETGFRLKYRQHNRMPTEEAHAPNFLIML